MLPDSTDTGSPGAQRWETPLVPVTVDPFVEPRSTT
jgi:hypothetical protein